MSKTKEQILECVADVSEGAASRNPTASVTVSEALKAMDEYAQQQVNEYKTLLDRAANLVGNPGTNISSSTDIAAENWQKDYEAFKKLNP